MRDYVTYLIAINRKISSPPSQEQQLDQLHRNLRPQLEAMVRRTEFHTVEGLLELAVDAEQTVENSRAYRPPPQPAATLLPEMAYKPLPYAEAQRKPKEGRQSGPPNPNQTGKDASSRGNYASSTNSGGNPPMEQRPPLSCYSCGQLGYIARHCPNCSGKGEEERLGGIAHTPSPNVKRKLTAAACNRGPDAPESMANSPVSSRGEASTKRPSDAEERWSPRIGVGESEVRALLDPGASTTVMGTVGLQLATALGCKFVAFEKPGVRLPNGRCSPLLGHTILPITVAELTRALRVAIMP